MDEVRLNILKAQLDTMDKVNPIRANEIRKSIQDKFRKSGEGSRGGKVIGHTKSGKPIYDKYLKLGSKNKVRSEYENFTKEDHEDAQDLHNKILTEAYHKHGTDSQGKIKKYDWNEYDHRASENFHRGRVSKEE